MYMFDILKKEVKAKLIFQFMKNTQKPQYLEILQNKTDIGINMDEIEINFEDSSINEYKVYYCYTKLMEQIQTNSISIYYNQTNYYQCGDGKHSVEIIFSDFLNKSIKREDCLIEYDGVVYYPTEDFGLLTRKRINFINVDINKFKFPKDINNNEININTIDNNNFLISISIIDKPKIIAIYLNYPFIEMKLKYSENELIQILNKSLESLKKCIYVNDKEEYSQYFLRYSVDIINLYTQEIIKSFDIEKKITEYFLIPRQELNKEQIIVYDLYSDFMAYFPDISNNSREEKSINGLRYFQQYYYTATLLNNFYKSIPEKINESDKVKLKYSACRCLRTLLDNGIGECRKKLFQFRDFTNKETIYYDANFFNKKLIDLLNEKSEIFLFFLQINSGSGVNLLNNEFMARISMLNEKNIKDNLRSTIQKYGIAILCETEFNACTFNEVKITCINEQTSLGGILDNDDLLNENDHTYNKRYILSNLMQHEDFGHINFSINFYAFHDYYIDRTEGVHYFENLSPFKYYMINSKKEKIQEIFEEVKKIKKIQNQSPDKDKYKLNIDEKLNKKREEKENKEKVDMNKEENDDDKKFELVEKEEKEQNEIKQLFERKNIINNEIWNKRKSKVEQNEEVVIKGESGIALSFFLTRGKYQLMKVLRKNGIDFKELYNKPELLAAEDLSEYINKLSEIHHSYKKLFEGAKDSNIEYKTRFQNSNDSNTIPYGIPTLEKF